MTFERIDGRAQQGEWVAMAAHKYSRRGVYLQFSISPELADRLGLVNGDRLVVSRGMIADANWIRMEKSEDGDGHTLRRISRGGSGGPLSLRIVGRALGIGLPHGHTECTKLRVEAEDPPCFRFIVPEWARWERQATRPSSQKEKMGAR